MAEKVGCQQIRLQRDCGFHLGTPSDSLTYLLWGKPDATLWATLWRGPWCKGLQATPSEKLRPLPNSLWGTESWWLPTTLYTSLKTDFLQVGAFMRDHSPGLKLNEPHEIPWAVCICVCVCVCVKSLQSCPTLCNPMDYCPSGFSVHGILHARILEWVAMLLLQGIFPTQGLNLHLLHLLHWQGGSLPLAPLGKPTLSHRQPLNCSQVPNS